MLDRENPFGEFRGSCFGPRVVGSRIVQNEMEKKIEHEARAGI